jgi:hypothetical protein
LRCRCGNVEPLRSSFWLKVGLARLAFVAAGAGAGWSLAVSDPVRIRLWPAIAVGGAVGILLPELTRLHKRARPIRGTRSPMPVPVDSSAQVNVPDEIARPLRGARPPGLPADA